MRIPSGWRLSPLLVSSRPFPVQSDQQGLMTGLDAFEQQAFQVLLGNAPAAFECAHRSAVPTPGAKPAETPTDEKATEGTTTEEPTPDEKATDEKPADEKPTDEKATEEAATEKTEEK